MTINWHERFVQQSYWTKTLRDHLLQSIVFDSDSPVMEVGCGTGAILAQTDLSTNKKIIGIDKNIESLLMATRNCSNCSFFCADALQLPFTDGSFGLIYCHFFLLWLSNPGATLIEVHRILRDGGSFIAFAEPDYSSRVDFPPPLDVLGVLQAQALHRQGADVGVGKKLPSLLLDAGFELLNFGIIGYESIKPGIPQWWDSEWETLRQDLSPEVSKSDLYNFQEIDRQSWLSGKRVLWVPTYYAVARKR